MRVTWFKPIRPNFALSDPTLFPIPVHSKFSNDKHCAKAPVPISFTLAGILMDVACSKPENANAPIFVIVSGRWIVPHVLFDPCEN